MTLRTQNKKIKVVRIITRLNIGGPAMHAILLSEGLNKEKFETRLVTGKPEICEGDMSGLALQKKLDIEYVPELRREIGFCDPIAIFKLFKFIREIKPDIVHTHTAKAGTLGRTAAILAGVPIRIHTFHGHVLEGYFSPLKARFFLLVERILGFFTHKIIAVSESVRRDVVDKFRIVSNDKCSVINLGLELDDFLNNGSLKGAFKRSISVDSETMLVGIIGRLVPIKNHKMFLNAAKRVVSSGLKEKVKFVIVGDGELKDELVGYTKNIGLNESVIFTGWRKDLPSVYADLDIAVLTSANEGTPLSLIEASASSRPVIATDVGGVRDIVINGETGLLVKKDDVEDLAEKISRLLEDMNQRCRLGEKGRDFMKDRYDKNRLIRDIEHLYADMATDN